MMLVLSPPSSRSLPRDPPTTTANMTMAMNLNMATLPILSSSASSQRSSSKSPALPSASRPKLRLDTQPPRCFGKNSTSLRLDTLSAVSPTVRNTFSNAYEPPQHRPRLSLHTTCDSTVSQASSASTCTPSSASTPASSLDSASNDSATTPFPYKQPHNLTSILRNSQAPATRAPRNMAAVRPFFPAEKKVSFRTPLDEEITTIKYTLAHSDLESSSSTISSLSLSTTSSSSISEDDDQDATSEVSASIEITPAPQDAASSSSPSSASSASSTTATPNPRFLSLENSPRPRGAPAARAGDKRDSSESDSDDSCPETPVAGRRKRRRDWRWTLGPLPPSSSSHRNIASPGSSASEATASTSGSEHDSC
ncbi:unnamed protein product [Periconia digitata]|uniref:Uncharacterized protein n=1 Tax=Periconia digitata TaxID=1303443 RepID=A0A9W4UNC5_9PLEO|nr:unnamed protein product [Periconia digitata]